MNMVRLKTGEYKYISSNKELLNLIEEYMGKDVVYLVKQIDDSSDYYIEDEEE